MAHTSTATSRKQPHKKFSFKTIRWLDHYSDSSWKSQKEIKEWASKQTVCVSKGWVTYEDKNVIVLSASFDGDESYGENICILKKTIVK